MKKLLFAGVLMTAVSAAAFTYNVRQPSDALRPRYQGAAAGEWTLDVNAALTAAKAEGKCTVLFNTGSWWCPYCETMEDLVLKSDEWKSFVKENGFYLAMLDFPYRGTVPAEQVSESWHPELGPGWGFKCWLMCPEYLSANGLTEEDGLKAIMAGYELQAALAPEGASEVVISNWNQTAEFRYGKVGYPTMIVFNESGEELGRAGFPWYSKESVSAEEARQYVFQKIEEIIVGGCTLCKEPLAGEPMTDRAQIYNGWLCADHGIAGTVMFKTSRISKNGVVKVSGSTVIGGRKFNFKSVNVTDIQSEITLEFNGVDSLPAVVRFGETGLEGTVAGYRIAGGGRNVFKAVDDKALVRRVSAPIGYWSVVLDPPAEAASPFAGGYGTLSVKITKSGKASVSGRLADGTKVSLTAQAIIGEDGMACLPVYVPLYSKRGSIGFVMWFKSGRLLGFGDVAPWISAGKNEFVSVVKPNSTSYAGTGDVPEELELTIIGLDDVGAFDTVIATPKRWVGVDTKFKASVKKSTGVLSGNTKIVVDGRLVSARFYGIIMGGGGYGTVIVPKLGSWAAKIAVCGGCSD